MRAGMSSNIHLEDISHTQGTNTPPGLCGTPDVQEDRTSVRNISLRTGTWLLPRVRSLMSGKIGLL
ncbi:unnamed protein product [Staurois parvus]|uniref:Uncharacterized protein n=1 Tax=Staurois parvus TaxID=386267 RepID=A0ABN9BKD0_9NEOB|nr:unnamed protein product [Staurois parvus]